MTTTQQSYATLITRELRALARELEAYPDEALIWRLPAGAPNSAGTLALHLTGNIRHFIGARLGGTGYVRDRDAEFARREVPRAELLGMIEESIGAVESSLARVDDAALDAPYPQLLRDRQVQTAHFLAHLASHAAYHLGQVDYHRRLVTGDASGIDAMSVGELRGVTDSPSA